MDDSQATSLMQVRELVAANSVVQFVGQRREEVYGWVERTLVRHEYASLRKPDKGILRLYIAQMTGLSRAQVTRLISGYQRTGKVIAAPYRRTRFPSVYTSADVSLLAYVDRAHGNLSGPATRRILEREHREYGQTAYQRLAAISVAHLYRLRNTDAYRKRNASYQPTRPTPVRIGERRKPQPQGSPGYLRLDTVHQGDQEGRKGLYHINAVDEVTQWEIVAATPQISEFWLLPVLDAILHQFPFVIRGFHSDNGSEFINHTVARLLDKLLIQQTRSRAHHSGDNGLVESKNGAIIRKHIGYGYIAPQHATPWVNSTGSTSTLTSISIGRARCLRSSLPPTASAAGSTSVGRPLGNCFGNCRNARSSCARASPSTSWSITSNCNPIPRLPWPCSKPNANCSAD
jgi:transposase InsO family protein